MKSRKQRIGIFVAVALGALVAFGFFREKAHSPAPKLQHTKISVEGRSGSDTHPGIPNSGGIGSANSGTSSGTISVPPSVLLNVPFTSQAPQANWSDPNQEAGCEEASMIMAWHWLKGGITGDKIDPQQALNELQDLFKFEQGHYGNSIDTSAADTAKTWKDYYHVGKASVQYDITNDDIIAELAKGNLVLIPANGQALNNPNFKVPGPLTHMLVIRGYDDASQEYITNDPGTRNGKGYKYAYSTLFNAIRDYPTGDHVPFTDGKKAMLVISK
jgi:hypothetical protein